MKRLLILLSFCLIGCCEQSSTSRSEIVEGKFTKVIVPVDVQRVKALSKSTWWTFYEVTYKDHVFMVAQNDKTFVHAPYCPCHQKETSNNLFNPYGQNF